MKLQNLLEPTSELARCSLNIDLHMLPAVFS